MTMRVRLRFAADADVRIGTKLKRIAMRPLTLLENFPESAFLDSQIDSALEDSELGLHLFLGEFALSD